MLFKDLLSGLSVFRNADTAHAVTVDIQKAQCFSKTWKSKRKNQKSIMIYFKVSSYLKMMPGNHLIFVPREGMFKYYSNACLLVSRLSDYLLQPTSKTTPNDSCPLPDIHTLLRLLLIYFVQVLSRLSYKRLPSIMDPLCLFHSYFQIWR